MDPEGSVNQVFLPPHVTPDTPVGAVVQIHMDSKRYMALMFYYLREAPHLVQAIADNAVTFTYWCLFPTF